MIRPAANEPALEPEVRNLLLEALSPVSLPVKREAALRQRVLEAAISRAEPLMEVRRAEDGRWHGLLPGVALKSLRVDVAGWSQTSLWRLDPGARIPPHPHTAEEECLVVEGSVLHGDTEYRAGDYLLARRGLQHGEIRSPQGALLLIRGELSAHLLALFSAETPRPSS